MTTLMLTECRIAWSGSTPDRIAVGGSEVDGHHDRDLSPSRDVLKKRGRTVDLSAEPRLSPRTRETALWLEPRRLCDVEFSALARARGQSLYAAAVRRGGEGPRRSGRRGRRAPCLRWSPASSQGTIWAPRAAPASWSPPVAARRPRQQRRCALDAAFGHGQDETHGVSD